MKISKSRFLALHPETNSGKIAALETLQTEYTAYVKICVDLMIERRVFNLRRSEMKTFPRAARLTAHIERNARAHAIGKVSGWSSLAYTQKVKGEITRLKKSGEVDSLTAKALYTIGKHSVQVPFGSVTQGHIDQYWKMLLATVKLPTISNRIGIRMSVETCGLEPPEDTSHPDLWLRISTLTPRKSVWLPLGSPHVKKSSDVGKGILARKTKKGTWRFEALDTKDWEVPEPSQDATRVGVDVGLNVIAATSDGRLLGADLKPKFDKAYQKVKDVRANRQRQGFKENSLRLDRLESKLSGLTRTATGTAANKLVASYPGHVFVIEDLDLRGCKGQKRFCYKALHASLSTKAPTQVVNPAYSSQTCPGCGYVSRSNRSGIKFVCRSCGRISHADVVGASNLLGRSEDKQITCDDHPSVVKRVLRGRYLQKRSSSLRHERAPVPMGLRLTTEGFSQENIGTASNWVPSGA